MDRRKVAFSLLFGAAVAVVWAVLVPRSPVRLTLGIDGEQARLSIDGATHALDWDLRPRTVALLGPQAIEREYQIDGSDSTSQGTLDWAYFAAFSASPYYRFQSWLRAEETYSRWANIHVVDTASGSVLLQSSVVPDVESLVLPERYVLQAEVHRLEKPVALMFSDGAGNGYLLRIDRNDRAVQVQRWLSDGRSDEIGRWYFPRSARPFAAILWDMLARVVLWAFVLAVIIIVLAGVLAWAFSGAQRNRPSPYPSPLGERGPAPSPSKGEGWDEGAPALSATPHPHPIPLPARERGPAPSPSQGERERVAALLVLACAFGLVCYVTIVKYNGLPHIFDSLSLFTQAKILASGRLYTPPPPHLGLFDYPFMVVHEGRYFSQYAPGVPVTIALFMLLSPGLAWLAGPAVSVLTLAGLFAVARLMYGGRVALLVLLLGALSPFYLFMSGSLMSHPFSLFYLTFFLLFIVRYYLKGGIANLAAGGALLGLAAISRESAALFFGAPWAAIVLGEALWQRWRKALPHVAVFVLWFAAIAALYLVYNAILSGDPLRTPRALFDARDRYGFGDVGFYGLHTLAAGLVVTDAQVTMLLIHLFGWPFYLTLAPALIPFISGRFRGWDVANALTALVFVFGFAGYYYHGIVYGPRYYYEALPFFVMLTARGFQVAGELAAAVWRRWRGAAMGGAIAAAIVLALLIACNLFYYLPRQMQLYDGYAGGSKKPDLATIYGTRPANAVIMTDDMFLYRDVLAPLNCIDFMLCDPVYVLVRSQRDVQDAQRLYPGRAFYWLRDDGGRASFAPAE